MSGSLLSRFRTCQGGICDGETRQTESEDCNTDACVCTFTYDDFEEMIGGQTPAGPIGWVEVDGEEGQGSSELPVKVGDELALGDVVQLALEDKCGHW